jgi:hypothetical protein
MNRITLLAAAGALVTALWAPMAGGCSVSPAAAQDLWMMRGRWV